MKLVSQPSQRRREARALLSPDGPDAVRLLRSRRGSDLRAGRGASHGSYRTRPVTSNPPRRRRPSTRSTASARATARRLKESWRCRGCFSSCKRERPSSAPAAGEPRGALDRGMRIVLRCDWRWLRCRPGHLGWRYADAHNDPISAALRGDPAGAGICSSPPFDLGHGLITRH